MPESASGAASERAEVGSYFVANYPPFSVWTKQAVDENARPALASSPAPGIPLGLYLHIPFCRKRCHFCYFRVYTEKNARDVATTSTRSSSRASRAGQRRGTAPSRC